MRPEDGCKETREEIPGGRASAGRAPGWEELGKLKEGPRSAGALKAALRVWILVPNL